MRWHGGAGWAWPCRSATGATSGAAVDRFLVVEEMLRWGAPLHHHWTADRQSGQVILRFGTEEQRQRFLPPICAGELAFAIGLSEPDAGSDLAGIKTRATKVEGGWRLNGTKIWTTNAHRSDWMIALCRTSESEDRHDGLSQFLIDLTDEGVRHPSDPVPRRGAPLQRGGLRGRVRARRAPPRATRAGAGSRRAMSCPMSGADRTDCCRHGSSSRSSCGPTRARSSASAPRPCWVGRYPGSGGSGSCRWPSPA